MTIGRIEQLTAHVNRELGSIKTGLEAWQRKTLRDKDSEIERLGDDNSRLNKMFRWIWGRVTNNEPGPPPVDVAVERMAEWLDMKDLALFDVKQQLEREVGACSKCHGFGQTYMPLVRCGACKDARAVLAKHSHLWREGEAHSASEALAAKDAEIGWLKALLKERDAELAAKDARIKQLEAALSGEMMDSANEAGESETRIAALETQTAIRDAEIARMNKIWDDAVDYGARVRGALVETRDVLSDRVTSEIRRNGNVWYCRECGGVEKAPHVQGENHVEHGERCPIAVLVKYKPLVGESE